MSGNSHVYLQNERQFSKMDSNTESAYISIYDITYAWQKKIAYFK